MIPLQQQQCTCTNTYDTTPHESTESQIEADPSYVTVGSGGVGPACLRERVRTMHLAPNPETFRGKKLLAVLCDDNACVEPDCCLMLPLYCGKKRHISFFSASVPPPPSHGGKAGEAWYVIHPAHDVLALDEPEK